MSKTEMENNIVALTNAFLPIHFCSLPQCYLTLKQGNTLWNMSFLVFAMMLQFSMMENCH